MHLIEWKSGLNNSHVNLLKCRGKNVLGCQVRLILVNANGKLACILSGLDNTGANTAGSVEAESSVGGSPGRKRL